MKKVKMEMKEAKAVFEAVVAEKQHSKKPTAEAVKKTILNAEAEAEAESRIFKGVCEIAKHSDSVKYIVAESLKEAGTWKLVNIAWKGKPYINKEGKTELSKAEGVAFQNVAKGYVRKITLQ
jgi:hypothetical protein